MNIRIRIRKFFKCNITIYINPLIICDCDYIFEKNIVYFIYKKN